MFKTKLITSIAPDVPPLEGTTTAFRMEFDLAEIMKDDMLRKVYEGEEFGFVVLKTKESQSYILTSSVEE